MHSIKPESMRRFWSRFTSLHFSEERGSCGHLLWPWMFLRNFFHSRGMEAKIYSILCGSSSFFSYWLINCLKQQITGRWLVDGFVNLCWYCLWGHRSVSYSHHAGNGTRNILSIGPTLLAAHQSRKAGIQLCSFSWRKIFPVWQSEIESEWSHLISCSTIPTRPM